MELILLTTGEVTSPNYPNNYPNFLEKTETIQVEQGLILLLQFTAFNIESHSTCSYDHLTITDGDGTTLMEKSCGTTIPDDITSTSNIVKLVFSTDSGYTMPGWSVSWSAVTPGECQQYVWIFLNLSNSFFLTIMVDNALSTVSESQMFTKPLLHIFSSHLIIIRFRELRNATDGGIKGRHQIKKNCFFMTILRNHETPPPFGEKLRKILIFFR